MPRAASALRHPKPPARPIANPPARPPAAGPADAVGGAAVAAELRGGRGAQSNATGRYEPLARVAFDDGWQRLDDLPAFKTSVTIDATRTVITRNDSPDLS